MASCGLCRYFMADTVGDGSGIGNCKVLEHYRAKGLSEKALETLFMNELGGKVFWRGTDYKREDRNCKKYIEINELDKCQ